MKYFKYKNIYFRPTETRFRKNLNSAQKEECRELTSGFPYGFLSSKVPYYTIMLQNEVINLSTAFLINFNLVYILATY